MVFGWVRSSISWAYSCLVEEEQDDAGPVDNADVEPPPEPALEPGPGEQQQQQQQDREEEVGQLATVRSVAFKAWGWIGPLFSDWFEGWWPAPSADPNAPPPSQEVRHHRRHTLVGSEAKLANNDLTKSATQSSPPSLRAPPSPSSCPPTVRPSSPCSTLPAAVMPRRSSSAASLVCLLASSTVDVSPRLPPSPSLGLLGNSAFPVNDCVAFTAGGVPSTNVGNTHGPFPLSASRLLDLRPSSPADLGLGSIPSFPPSPSFAPWKPQSRMLQVDNRLPASCALESVCDALDAPGLLLPSDELLPAGLMDSDLFQTALDVAPVETMGTESRADGAVTVKRVSRVATQLPEYPMPRGLLDAGAEPDGEEESEYSMAELMESALRALLEQGRSLLVACANAMPTWLQELMISLLGWVVVPDRLLTMPSAGMLGLNNVSTPLDFAAIFGGQPQNASECLYSDDELLAIALGWRNRTRPSVACVSTLGTGGFSTVFCVGPGQGYDGYYALKVTDLGAYLTSDAVTGETTGMFPASFVQQEPVLLAKLGRYMDENPDIEPFAVRQVAWALRGPCLFSLQQLAEAGSLEDHVGQVDDPATIQYVFGSLVRHLYHLRQAGVLHCDVKPSNALVTRTGQLLLADFNCSVEVETARCPEGYTLQAYTKAFAAPEVKAMKPLLADGRADVYSLGETVTALLHPRLQSQFMRATEGPLKDIWRVIKTTGYQALLDIGVRRPTYEQLLSHGWVGCPVPDLFRGKANLRAVALLRQDAWIAQELVDAGGSLLVVKLLRLHRFAQVVWSLIV